jgi:GAF domain-containing protein
VEDAVNQAAENLEDYEFEHRVTHDDGEVRWLRARGHPVKDENGRIVRVVGIVSDVTEQRRQAEHNRFLAAAGKMLAGSLDVDQTLERVAGLLTEHIVDWCVIQTLDELGRLRNHVVAHRDPDLVALALRLAEEYPPPPEPTGIAAMVLESGEPILVEEVDDEMLVAAAVDDRHLEILRSLGLRSVMTIPLEARGKVLGLLSLVAADGGRRFDQSDLAFAGEFARRAGQALDGARLFESMVNEKDRAERIARRLGVLQDLITSLTAAGSVAEVAERAARLTVSAAGANRGTIVVSGDAGPEIAGSFGYEPDVLERYRDHVGGPGPLAETLKTGQAVFCESVTDLVSKYPSLASIAPADGAFCALPVVGEGLTGAIGLVYEAAHLFSDDDRTMFDAFSRHVSVAMGRAQLSHERERVALGLQQALAPPVDVRRPGVRAEAAYRPSGVGGVGGDWYDVVDLGGESYAYVIGDVVGRGLEAVATMAQLRQSLRMLLIDGRKPSDALAALGLVSETDDAALCATILCAVVERNTATIEFFSAGHLPPIVIAPSGVRMLDVPTNPPLGLNGSGGRSLQINLSPAECVVFYTDGVVERRDRSIDASIDILLNALRAVEPNPQAAVDALMMMAADADDDATVLAIQLH